MICVKKKSSTKNVSSPQIKSPSNPLVPPTYPIAFSLLSFERFLTALKVIEKKDAQTSP